MIIFYRYNKLDDEVKDVVNRSCEKWDRGYTQDRANSIMIEYIKDMDMLDEEIKFI